MAIETDTFKESTYWVWVSCGIWVDKHYEKLGYILPKKFSKWGKLNSRGLKMLVKVEHLLKESEVKVIRVCDICGDKSHNIKYSLVIRNRDRSDGIDRCKKCSAIKGGKSKRENVPYHKSFACKNPQITESWHPTMNGDLTPDKIYASSGIYCWWVCPECNSPYGMTPARRMNAHHCPYCYGRRVNEKNCLWTTNPETAKRLWNDEDGYKYNAGSHAKVDFKCEDCDLLIKNKEIKSVVTQGLSCPRCSDGKSYPEKFMSGLLTQIGIEFQHQKIFQWSKDYRHKNDKLKGKKIYDFFIPSVNAIIEVHGAQHYRSNFGKNSRTTEEEQENDAIKMKLAMANEIKNYITIDCRISELDFIRNNISTSEIVRIFDISNIDWNKCHEYGCCSLIKNACEYWNEGDHSVSNIANTMNINYNTVTRYLKQGLVLGWCDYDKEKSHKERSNIVSKKTSKKVIRMSLNEKYVEEYDSIKQAVNETRTSYKSIIDTCKGRVESVKGYRWMYKSEYDLTQTH